MIKAGHILGGYRITGKDDDALEAFHTVFRLARANGGENWETQTRRANGVTVDTGVFDFPSPEKKREFQSAVKQQADLSKVKISFSNPPLPHGTYEPSTGEMGPTAPRRRGRGAEIVAGEGFFDPRFG